ncbi:UDP-N-acetylmuramate dehydrogenase [Euzebya tangerina]|uniref:UDP-N-acetylmuramate dehydrogenase n=1 Tax=Euzebya tangerina TaxID=591198 RepID=UPI0013C2F78B|nr:UDP-N-acetylmuramate dehydrogenase [Euzebya tangerina]
MSTSSTGTDWIGLLETALNGETTRAAPLADRTTLKVGGSAALLARAESVDDLRAIADVCRGHAVPWLIIGRGSNMLVADEGWPGVAIVLGRGLRGVEVLTPGAAPDTPATVQLGGAEPMPVLAVALERLGLGGMAFAVAIPGTVGGAVRMNAGAHGGQMADVLVSATVLSMTDGTTRTISAEELAMTYRHTALPDDVIVLDSLVRLPLVEPEPLAADMAEMRQWRRDHQPINQPSCGSVFRNPPGDSAGRLIDALGLKGHRVGGAVISHKHANFITTEPGARAADVYAIIRHVQREVRREFDIVLNTEVVLIGDFDPEV